jgi:hypothetical protein
MRFQESELLYRGPLVMTTYDHLAGYQRFGETYCTHLHGAN